MAGVLAGVWAGVLAGVLAGVWAGILDAFRLRKKWDLAREGEQLPRVGLGSEQAFHFAPDGVLGAGFFEEGGPQRRGKRQGLMTDPFDLS